MIKQLVYPNYQSNKLSPHLVLSVTPHDEVSSNLTTAGLLLLSAFVTMVFAVPRASLRISTDGRSKFTCPSSILTLKVLSLYFYFSPGMRHSPFVMSKFFLCNWTRDVRPLLIACAQNPWCEYQGPFVGWRTTDCRRGKQQFALFRHGRLDLHHSGRGR